MEFKLSQETLARISNEVIQKEIEHQVEQQSAKIKGLVEDKLKEYLDGKNFTDSVHESMNSYIDDNDFINDAIEEYLDSREGAALVKRAITSIFKDK